jgi:hypothetical protein
MALPKSFSEGLTLADKLAEFANLQPEGVAEFRKNYDFAPSGWWDHRGITSDEDGVDFIWKDMQKKVRAAWETGFSPDDCLELIVAGAKRAELQDMIKADEEQLNVELKDEADAAEWFRKRFHRRKPQVFEYQQALMFLHVQPWRAAKCPGAMDQPCGKFFVKQAKRSIYCSDRCFNANRSADKRKWWIDVGTKQRAQKMKAKKKRTKGGK